MAQIPRLKTVSVNDEITVHKRLPELIRVPAEKTLSGVLLCNAPFHMPTHFNGTHTLICAGEGVCELCPHCATKDYYLVALLDKNTSVVSWVQLTDHAARSLLRQVRDLQRPFFGTLITVGRERKTMKAPITVVVDQWATVSGKLPKPMDPQETLERVFNSPKLRSKRRPKPV